VAASVTHAFVSGKSDGGDATQVRPSDWNDEHVLDDLPGEELDYVEWTGVVSPTATTEGTANTIVTGSSVAYDGSTIVMIQFFAPFLRPDAAAASRTLSVWLYEDGASIGQIGHAVTSANTSDAKPADCWRRLTPTATSHTYSIRCSVSAGTGRLEAGTGGLGNFTPGFIRITRV